MYNYSMKLNVVPSPHFGQQPSDPRHSQRPVTIPVSALRALPSEPHF
jgi:hypothetical protein